MRKNIHNIKICLKIGLMRKMYTTLGFCTIFRSIFQQLGNPEKLHESDLYKLSDNFLNDPAHYKKNKNNRIVLLKVFV